MTSWCFYIATVVLGLYLQWKVHAFYRCQTAIRFSHFEMEGERSFVCKSEMGPAQPNRALASNLHSEYNHNQLSSRRHLRTIVKSSIKETDIWNELKLQTAAGG